MSSAEANVAKPTTLSESTIKAHKSVARRLALIAALGGLLYGYDSAVINGATNAIKTEFATGDALLGLAVGSALLDWLRHRAEHLRTGRLPCIRWFCGRRCGHGGSGLHCGNRAH